MIRSRAKYQKEESLKFKNVYKTANIHKDTIKKIKIVGAELNMPITHLITAYVECVDTSKLKDWVEKYQDDLLMGE